MDYNAFHARRAQERMNVAGKRVLIIGCNTGERDCRQFIEFGAVRVDGVDVIEDIGKNFQHERVFYHRTSVQSLTFRKNSFDLVYSFATMEHVSDVEGGFRQMIRVLAPEGTIYSIAAPLWRSRNGHHKAQFFGAYPWIHLRKTADEILEYCDESGLSAEHGRAAMEHHVRFMLNDQFFNKRSSFDYLEHFLV